MSAPLPNPCNTRAAINSSMEGAAAHIADVARNATTVSRNARRAPAPSM